MDTFIRLSASSSFCGCIWDAVLQQCQKCLMMCSDHLLIFSMPFVLPTYEYCKTHMPTFQILNIIIIR